MLSFEPFNLLFTVINVLILFLLLKKFLFNPVNKIIAKRQEMIDQQISEAEGIKKEALDTKSEYEKALKSAKTEAADIVNDARSRAMVEYNRIVADADVTAGKMVTDAQKKIAAERARTLRQLESEITGLVMHAATKVVGKEVSADTNSQLYDLFLAEVGEENDAGNAEGH